MSKTTTWMPLNIGDYLADTMHLRAAEHGAYLLLLMHYWRNGPLPDDDAKLSGIARMTRDEWSEISATIREFFHLENGQLHQKRADDERAKAEQISSKRAGAARSMHMQRGSNCTANAPANAEQMHEVCRGFADDLHEGLQTHARVLIPSPLQETEDKKGKEEREAPLRSAPPSDLLDAAPPSKPDARGTRLPEDWEPDEPGRAYASGLGLDVESTSEDFRRYWCAKAGKDARKVSWPLTWQTWCKRASQDRMRRRGPPQQKPGKLDYLLKDFPNTIDGEAA